MNEELSTFIVKELSTQRNRIEIIQRVRQRSGLTWKQAEQLVILIEARHNRSIVVQPAPLLLFLSIGRLILGIGLLGFNLQVLLTFLQKDVLGRVSSLQSGPYLIMGSLTGLGMPIAGLIGLWKSFGTIFPK